MSRHYWKPEDDTALIEIVAALEQPDALDKRSALWQAVSGALAVRGVVVSPGAANTRYYRLVKAEAEAKAPEPRTDPEPGEGLDAWQRTAALVEQYEATQLERIERTLVVLESEVSYLRADVAAIKAVWE